MSSLDNNKQLTLSGIVNYILKNHPYCQIRDEAFGKSVLETLNSRPFFVSVPVVFEVFNGTSYDRHNESFWKFDLTRIHCSLDPTNLTSRTWSRLSKSVNQINPQNEPNVLRETRSDPPVGLQKPADAKTADSFIARFSPDSPFVCACGVCGETFNSR